jgi:hypothetical protein
MIRVSKLLLLLLVVMLIAESRAYAYTDPGSGTMLLQLLAAFLVGLLFYLRRITAWVRGIIRVKHPDESGNETTTEPVKD